MNTTKIKRGYFETEFELITDKPKGFDNFEITDKTNTNKIEFVSFDFSKAGVYGKIKWLKKAQLPESILAEFDKVVDENMNKNTKRD